MQSPLDPLIAITPFLDTVPNKKLPYGIKIASGKKVTFQNLYEAAKKLLEDKKEEYEENDSDECQHVMLIRDFCQICMIYSDKKFNGFIYLNIGVVNHFFSPESKFDLEDLREDMLILNKNSFKETTVKDALIEFLDRPIFKKCNENLDGFGYAGMRIVNNKKYNQYYEFEWDS